MTCVYLSLNKNINFWNVYFSVWIVCYWRNYHSLFLKKIGNTSQHSYTLYTQNFFGLFSIISKSWPNTKSYFPWGLATLSYWNFKTIMWFFKEPQLWKWSTLCFPQGSSSSSFSTYQNLSPSVPLRYFKLMFKHTSSQFMLPQVI